MNGRGEETADLPGIRPYATFIFLGMAGFAAFPLISYHFKAQAIISDAAIPLVYASAMAVSVVVALLIGRAFDRIGAHALLTIPVLSTATVLLAFSLTPVMAVADRSPGGRDRDLRDRAQGIDRRVHGARAQGRSTAS